MSKKPKQKRMKCAKWGCNSAALIYLRLGDTLQTRNGFVIAKVPGYVCPNCAGDY